jgi:DNA-binding NarL/FixJ family response regulator
MNTISPANKPVRNSSRYAPVNDQGWPASACRGTILVMHDLPAYRLGLVSKLNYAGYQAKEAPVSSGREAQASRPDIFCGIDGCLIAFGERGQLDTFDKSLLTRGGSEPGIPVIALLPQRSLDCFRSALDGGASGAVAQDDPAEEIVAVLEAALRGRVLLPESVVKGFIGGQLTVPSEITLSKSDVKCLAGLARGQAVPQLAAAAGYSQRQMYRELQKLYRRIGAKGRGEAIALAAQWGIHRVHRLANSPGGAAPSRSAE